MVYEVWEVVDRTADHSEAGKEHNLDHFDDEMDAERFKWKCEEAHDFPGVRFEIRLYDEKDDEGWQEQEWIANQDRLQDRKGS